jgi:hypothetical protein
MKRKYIPKKISVFLKNYKWLLAVIAIQFILVNHFLPISEVFNSKPITNDDYPIMFYTTYVRSLSFSTGKTSIYNPFFYSGYIDSGNFIGSEFIRNRFAVSPVFAIPFSSTIAGFKFYIFTFNLIFPLVMLLAAMNFDLGKREAIVVAFLSCVIWNFEQTVHNTNYYGIPFTFESYILIFVVSLFYKLSKNDNSHLFLYFLCFLLLIIAGLSVGFIHLLSLIVLAIPFTIFVYKKSKLFFALLATLTILSIVLIWTLIINFTNNFNPLPFYQSGGLQTIFLDFQNNALQLVIAILGFYGVYRWKNEKFKFVLFLTTSTFFFAFSYFGSLSYTISFLEPKRLLIPLNFLLIFPSSTAISDFEKLFKKRVNKKLLLFFAIVAIMLMYFKTPEIYLDIKSQFQNAWEKYLITDIPKDVQELIFWIKENTTSDARILIEDSGHKVHQYGGHMIALFPLYTNREFIGGFYPDSGLKKEIEIPNFYDGILFNKKNVSQYSSDELEKYFDLYNIKWVVAWSNASKRTFNKHPELMSKIKEIGKFSIYENKIEPTFFIKGDGNITANYNIIEITNATPNGIILKYRYSKILKTEPMLKIEKYKLENITIAFMSIFNGNMSSFKIYI